LGGYGLEVFIHPLDGFYKVRIGRFTAKTRATARAEALREEGWQTWVVSHPK